MQESLKAETEKLVCSWSRHDATFLRDYLVADVEDPRVNVQSILSRHFLLGVILGDGIGEILLEELRFAVAMKWLAKLEKKSCGENERRMLLHALRQGADHSEAGPVPRFLLKIFASLPRLINGVTIPNYLEDYLSGSVTFDDCRGTFLKLWAGVLHSSDRPRISVVEPACGSANDYRFLAACGLAGCIDYTGFDLCEQNISNARALFPDVQFEVSNVFEINAANGAFDFCFFHDLLEHLSLGGMETAIAEICRVTRHGICAGFFQMDEISEHVTRPVDDYHCNLLSMEKVIASFAAHGFTARALHIDSYLHSRLGYGKTHNPFAYTLVATRRS